MSIGARVWGWIGLGIVVTAAVIGAVWLATKSGDAPGGPRSVLGAIRDLESERDPKCHSTACRFEDFLFGTPLSEEGRDAKVELQRELVRSLWTRASAVAARDGREVVGESDLRPLIDDLVTTETEDGTLEAYFPTAGLHSVEAVRVRQFASIAYALRAILSVEQDSLFEGTELADLDDAGIDAMKAAVEVVTLCALQVADADARSRSAATIDPTTMTTAWRQLVPSDAVAIDDPGATRTVDGAATRAMFYEMADTKIASYETYNDVHAVGGEDLFWQNVQTYYARFWLPFDDPGEFSTVRRAYDAVLRDFASRLTSEASRRAAEAGHPVIRSADATAAVDAVLPHEIDDFEDVHFFPNLLARFRITIESYDCDALRDTGKHWVYLKGAVEADPDVLVPDPFAAEILSEALSGYGVLVLRVAGDFGRETLLRSPTLSSRHLELARKQLTTLAAQDHGNRGAEVETPGIVSGSALASTAGGATFRDVTAESGVRFRHRSSDWLGEFRRTKRRPPTFSGGGVAAEDLDGDDDIDLLFVGGQDVALLVNDGAGAFQEITEESGLDFRRADGTHVEARQPIIADFDNDGLQDIFVSVNNDAHRLYRNLGGLRFEDVTDGTGFGGEGLVGGPATVFDYDNDGRLDVYITYFGDYRNGALPNQERHNGNALPNRLHRNLGGMRFEDVSEGSGADDTGWCQGVAHTDLDRDGLQDLIVANDFGRNALLRNLGGGRFEDIAPRLGVVKAYHSMNVGLADLNRDGFPDVYVSNIATMVKDNAYHFPDADTPLKFNGEAMANMLVKEANMLYLSEADGATLAAYRPSEDIERGETSTGWAWDAEFFDFDNDGDDDLYVVNGTNDYFLYDALVGTEEGGRTRLHHLSHQRESNVLFVNEGGMLRNRSISSGADLAVNARSTAYLDWDRDGDLDIAMNNFHSDAVLLQNDTDDGAGRGWVVVQLVGDPARGSNRDAIGARIVATGPDGLYVTREVTGGSGYMSMNPKRQHLGLGAATAVDLEIVWPNGERQRVEQVAAGRTHVIHQGVPHGQDVASSR